MSVQAGNALEIGSRDILFRAIDDHRPRAVFALFSGGSDSSVLLHGAHTAWLRGELTAAVHIDTGTALPGVRAHAEEFCGRLDVELKVYEAGDAYARMVRRYGVPGPGAHLYSYVWLKERQIDELVRQHKRKRSDRIMLLSGARVAESVRRMGKASAIERDGAQVWVNPLLYWDDAAMLTYRARAGIEPSEAAALMHRSGECNCGAYASKGEREMLQALYPEWFESTIAPLEDEAEALGLPCRWGQRRVGRDQPHRMCHCDSQLTLELGAT